MTRTTWIFSLFTASLPSVSAAQPVSPGSPPAQTYLCDGQRLTEREIAARHRITLEQLRLLGRMRSLSPEGVCLLPAERLEKELVRAERPAAPDQPDEAVRYRLLDLRDEKGFIPFDGLVRAREHVDQMRAERDSRRSAVEPVAGITPGSWTWLGPGNVGGRLRSIVIHPATPATMWVGSVGGGIWKTTNGGTSWSPVDDFMANLAVSSMAMDPTDSNVMYAGTGEGFFNGDAIQGAGIFKSTNGGTNWSQLAATANANFSYVDRIAISPDGNTLLAATRSGLFRSINDGIAWTLVYPSRTLDVDFDPANSSKAIAGRDDGTALWSIDGGATWNLATGPTSGDRVEVAYAPSATGTTYASIENGTGELWKSTDGGRTYALMNATAGYLGNQGWYDNVVWVSPTDANFVIVGGIDLWRSTNGGASLARISYWVHGGGYGPSAHADQHVITAHPGFNGTSNTTVFFGNDGGIYKAADVTTVGNDPPNYTAGWTELNNNLGITQFYGAAGHAGTGKIVGGTQDNGTPVYTTAGGTEAWSDMYGGDGGWCAADPTDSNYVYGEYVYLRIHRSTTGGTPFSSADIWGDITDAGTGAANFIAPFILDPNDPNTLLGGGANLWRSTNAKAVTPTWASIRPPGSSFISAIAVAPGNSNVIWVGQNDGKVYKTGSGTSATPVWTPVGTNPPLPGRKVTRIAIDPTNANVVYVTFGGFSADNVYRSTDGGSTWSDRTGSGATGLPDIPIRSLVIHPDNPQWLYVGGESGIFASEDAGATWHVPHDGPANVSVDELFILNNSARDLVAATHGRGVYKQATTGGGPTVTLAFTTSSQSVPENGSATATVRLTTSDGLAMPAEVRVHYATSDGTAVANGDYGSTFGTLTFPGGTANNATAPIVVPIGSDLLDEPNETFAITLSAPSGAGASLGSAVHTVTILDDDAAPALSIADVVVTEGNSGATSAVFPVALSSPSGAVVAVNYATANGTATASANPSSFPNSASISIVSPAGNVPNPATPYPSTIAIFSAATTAVGWVSKVTVTLNDFSHTYPSDVDVLLVGPGGQKVMLMSDVGPGFAAVAADLTFDDNGAALGPGPVVSGTYKPTNLGPDSGEADDTFPAPAPAGPYGSALSVFNGLSPTGNWSLFVVDDYSLDDGTIAGGFTLNLQTSTGDYVATSGTLTFNPGETVKSLVVPVLGDVTAESNETFFVNLGSPSGATLSDGQGQGTILNDDTSGLALTVVGPTTVAPGAPVQVQVTGGPGLLRDWVGLYATGAIDTAWIDWKYLSGTRTPPPAGLTSALITFTMPTTQGTYNFRFFRNETFTKLATSATVTVQATDPLIQATPTSLAFGSVSVGSSRDLTVTVKNLGVGTLAGGATVTGPAYSLIGTSSYSLGPNATAVLTVRFTPVASGGASGSLALTGGGGATVPLSGTGTVTPTLTVLGATTVAPGASVQVQVSNGPGYTKDWVGLHATGAADITWLDWMFLNGTRTAPTMGLNGATLTFAMPMAQGTYNFRFFQNNTFTKLATSVTITVQRPSPSLTVSTTTATPGQVIQVVVANGPGAPKDWVAMHAASAANTVYLDWKYLNGTHTSTVGFSAATLNFTMPTTPGTYNFRFFSNNTYSLLATSATVTVQAGPTPTVSLSTTTATPGQTIQVTIANGPGNAKDWVGMYSSAAADSAYLDWKYLNGTRTAPVTGVTGATLNFTVPMTPGTYNFRFFQNNTYSRLATSATVTVQ